MRGKLRALSVLAVVGHGATLSSISALRSGSEDSQATASSAPIGRVRDAWYPALEGLRGVAVVAVLFFHAEFVWAAGGYLGVSTFFVISGFLITQLLLAEPKSDAAHVLSRFWVRRFRRLAPAMVATLAGVLLLGFLGAFPSGSARPADLRAAAAQVSNWWFVVDGADYGALFAEPSPVLHFWSLAVEVQLYVLFPLLVFAVTMLTRWLGRSRTAGSRRAGVGVVVVALIAASALATTLARDAGQSRLYYGTDVRAMEFLVGAALAVALPTVASSVWFARLRRFGAPVALVLLVAAYSTVALAELDIARGGLLLIAGLSAICLAGCLGDDGVVSRALAAPVIRWIGRISYSLYLVHWPIYLVVKRAGWELNTWRGCGGAITLSVLIAAAMHRWIEPMLGHSGRPVAPRYSVAAGLVVVMLVAGFLPAAGAPIDFETAVRDAPALPEVAAAGNTTSVPEAPTRAPALGTAGADTGAEVEPASPAGVDGAAPTSGAEAPAGTPPDGSVGAATRAPAVTATPVVPGAGNEPVVVPLIGLEVDPPVVPLAGPGNTGADRTPLSRPLRVVVFGDSTALLVMIGMNGWGPETGALEVNNGSDLQCGIGRNGSVRYEGIVVPTRSQDCEIWAENLPARLGAFDPDIVLVLTGPWDVADRMLEGDDDWTTIGDPAYDRFLRSEIETVTSRLLASGAVVVWLTSPIISSPPANDQIRHDQLNAMIEDVMAEFRAGSREAFVVDYAGFLATCAGGVTDAAMRPDGVHLTWDSAWMVARWLGPVLTELAGYTYSGDRITSCTQP